MEQIMNITETSNVHPQKRFTGKSNNGKIMQILPVLIFWYDFFIESECTHFVRHGLSCFLKFNIQAIRCGFFNESECKKNLCLNYEHNVMQKSPYSSSAFQGQVLG